MTVFSSQRKRKACWVGEPAWRSVDYFGDQRQRLQRSGAEILVQQ
jgi:hypothetical protein